MTRFFWPTMVAGLALAIPSIGASVPNVVPQIQTGYHQMYNLEFDGAHKTFAQFEQQSPNDPLGHVSNAAAYLFAEFDRLNILQSEFFVNDDRFRHAKKLDPDPAVRKAFDGELAKAEELANGILARSPQDTEPDRQGALEPALTAAVGKDRRATGSRVSGSRRPPSRPEGHGTRRSPADSGAAPGWPRGRSRER